MVEDKAEPRETNWRQLLPWIDLFQGFRVAMDLNKLLLAAGGILVMAFGWWVLAAVFHTQKPQWMEYQKGATSDTIAAKWAEFFTRLPAPRTTLTPRWSSRKTLLPTSKNTTR
jgi:hypothetical protein